jgi:hypothetical protein
MNSERAPMVCWEFDAEEPRKRREYYEKLDTQNLINIAENAGDAYGHVECVLNVLHKREPATALSLAKSILEHKKGVDRVLFASMAKFMIEEEYEISYVKKFLEENDEVKEIYEI